MKKHLLPLALFLFLATQTKAQTSVYHAFPDSNAYWNQSEQWDAGDGCTGNVVRSIFIKGDTTIGSYLYHKLFQTGDSFPFPSSCGSAEPYFINQYIGAMRQDTAQREVFIYIDSSETLLYDFNLAVGDTMPGNDNEPSSVVGAVDSVLMGGNYRKRFWLIGASGQLIEGMGSTYGFMAPFYLLYDFAFQLNCFSQNGQTLWPDSSSSCDIETGVNEIRQEHFISLYPNPATNQLTIHTSFPADEKVMVSVMNVMGQEASPQAPLLNERGDVVIDVSGLAAGMYFVEVVGEKERWVGKFVKQ